MIEVGAGRQSQAEGRGRFMMRVMSAAPVVMDGSAEKAAVPHLAAHPRCAQTTHGAVYRLSDNLP